MKSEYELKKEFLIKRAQADGTVTTFHLNDTPLDWWDKFYRNKGVSYGKACKALSNFLQGLVKKGVFYPPIKCGTGFLGKTDSGCTWMSHFWLVGHPSSERHYHEFAKYKRRK